MSRFLPSLLTIGLGLGFGFLIGVLYRKYGKDQDLLARLRARIQILCILVINPVAFVGAVWVLPVNNATLAFLPLVGLAALASGFFVGWLAMRLQPLPTSGERIGFSISCSFTNLGNIGGLVVFLLLGEVGYSLVPFYKLFEEFWYYGVLFPFVRQRAAAAGLFVDHGSEHHTLLRTVRDPFFLIIALAVSCGLALNFSGFERPTFYGDLNAVLIPISSFLLLTSIGSQIRIGRIPRYWKPAASILALRMLTIPAVAIGTALLLGVGQNDPSMIRTVAVLAVMPVGFTCFVPANLYNLDADLVNAAWLMSMASLLVTVPLLSVFLV